MSDIYLHVDGAQTGPYQPDQVRQLLAGGKISAETLAWHQGLSEWAPVATVLVAFPAAVIAAAAPVAFGPPPSEKKQTSGILQVVIIGGVIFGAIFVFSCLAGILVGPITSGIKKAQESASMQATRTIGVAMFTYAVAHNGAYPDGATSTEVFQKLVDGKYIVQPGIFYLPMPGKVRATSPTLTSANVCYDVTSGVTSDSSDFVPVVFCTGYTVAYIGGASATPDSTTSVPFSGKLYAGITVDYKSNSARFIKAAADGSIPNFVPAGFDPGMRTYRQLRP
jgi:hypothetical protein